MSALMQLQPLPIADAFLIGTHRIGDERGTFARWYCDGDLQSALQGKAIVQINHSLTKEVGSVRGLHFQQPPSAEKKIIRCIAGSVFDVMVDLRRDSPTFLHWYGLTLVAGDDYAVLIPEGCAHGFQTLAADSQLFYLHTAHYDQRSEGAVRFDDPRLSIRWPLPVTTVSQRDRGHPLLPDNFSGISL